MIRTIQLKFGRGPGSPHALHDVAPLNVFVGPNNSGKSKILSEIFHWCLSGTTSLTNVIIEKVKFDECNLAAAEDILRRATLRPHLGESVRADFVIIGKKGQRHQVKPESLLESLKSPNSHASQFCQWYLCWNMLILDGKSRIGLVNQQSAGDLTKPPTTSFQVLFQDDASRAEVRRIVHEAIGSYLVVDPTDIGHLRLRLSDKPPESAIVERGWHAEAVAFHNAALSIEEASDGVKAFTGMITEIIAGDPHVLLIDEPEAFLHPSLSNKLGQELARATRDAHKRVFASTHSPNFVMGCIQSGMPVNITRLTYRGGVATARVLPNEEILKLMRNPLLRSTGVLNGLFYEFVIVTESDTDRAFYQEINERLLRLKPDWGIPNALFLNAQNKQTVRSIIKPLRELGIPAAAVVDVDVLKEGGSVWTDFIGSGFMPELENQSLGDHRAAVLERVKASGKDMKREGGIDVLGVSDREAASNLFDRLADYGLFVVRGGELESWLQALGARGHGPSWLIDVFTKMGEDPDSEFYVKPTEGDVWKFLSTVKQWLIDPTRKGIPA